jgi:predicted methyltransferase
MNRTSRFRGLILALISLALTACMGPGPSGWVAGDLAAALDTSDRSEADRARDAARKPAVVLSIVGVEPGMTVIDLMAAGGWYTEVLSIAVGPDGTVYAQNPPMMLKFRDGANDKALTARLADERLKNVVRKDGALGEIGVASESVDIAFTALNFHDTYNFGGAEAASTQLDAIFAILKPGGVLGLVDHAGDADTDLVKLHRMRRQVAIDLATEAGFVVEAESNALAHPEDDRTQMVFGPIRGKTDRFVLKLRKPV